MKSVFLFGIFLVIAQSAYGRIFTRCELARELQWQGFPHNELRDWVCLVESESSRDTGVVGGPNTDGSYDWGLFQINDRYWCGVGHNGGDCNVNCYDLLHDDITLASSCTRLIYNRHGFWAWYGWVAKCQEGLPDISDCGVF